MRVGESLLVLSFIECVLMNTPELGSIFRSMRWWVTVSWRLVIVSVNSGRRYRLSWNSRLPAGISSLGCYFPTWNTRFPVIFYPGWQRITDDMPTQIPLDFDHSSRFRWQVNTTRVLHKEYTYYNGLQVQNNSGFPVTYFAQQHLLRTGDSRFLLPSAWDSCCRPLIVHSMDRFCDIVGQFSWWMLIKYDVMNLYSSFLRVKLHSSFSQIMADNIQSLFENLQFTDLENMQIADGEGQGHSLAGNVKYGLIGKLLSPLLATESDVRTFTNICAEEKVEILPLKHGKSRVKPKTSDIMCRQGVKEVEYCLRTLQETIS
ncbi:hypothetical protein V6N12_076334 [Hibiscus sabdariffa]|uniref:Uncharacterized protein n=1 Tax=Hibiscus sabdariffa TaxID=183260 RepID=A0ABR2DCG0_9ROSI